MKTRNRDSSVDMAISYLLDGQEIGCSIHGNVQTGSEVHPASYPVGSEDILSEVKTDVD
jgi:hypothetical protein